MAPREQLITVTVALAGILAVGGCRAAASEPVTKAEPAHVELVDGSDVALVTVTARAAERLGIETVPARASGSGVVIPYSAVLYEADGTTWAYIQEGDLTFKRYPLDIETIEGDDALLTSGPPAGTPVVSVGATELFGTEFEVGH